MLIIGPSDLTGKVVWPWLFVSGSVISVLEKLSMDFLLKMFLDEKIVFNILLCKAHVLGN